MIFATAKNTYMQYTGYVIAVVAIMLVGLIVFLLGVKEKRWAAEMEEDTKRLGLEDEPATEADGGEKRKLSRGELKSLLLILASVALWYVGYNSITSKYSVYATNVLGSDYHTAQTIFSTPPMGATDDGSITLGLVRITNGYIL
jgi:Na+/melibiose symporter-like transporter